VGQQRPRWLNPLLWVLALLLVNGLWTSVAQQRAPNELNAPDRFETFRELEVAPVFGQSSAIPARLTTVATSSVVDEANLSVTVRLNNDTEVFGWSGLLSEGVPVWDGELMPGTYTIETRIEEGVDIEQSMDLQPFSSVQVLGHAVLSVLLVGLALAEQSVRTLIKRRKANESEQPSSTASPTQSAEPSSPHQYEDSPWREPLR